MYSIYNFHLQGIAESARMSIQIAYTTILFVPHKNFWNNLGTEGIEDMSMHMYNQTDNYNQDLFQN